MKEIKKERTHLFAPSINIAMMAEFTGEIEEDLMLNAVKEAINNNEVLQCKIALNEAGQAFYENQEKGIISFHSFEENWEEVVTAQESLRFDLQHGELVRFFVKRKDGLTQLVIIAHHLVGDGLAITYLLQDILNVINGRKLSYQDMKLYDVQTMPADSRLNVMMRLMLRGVNRNWSKNEKVFSFSEYEKMYQNFWSSHQTEIIIEKIDKEQLRKLVTEARLHKVTINSILVTAFAKAAGEKQEIGIPISLRDQKNHTLANYSTAVSIHHQYDETKDFWENTVSVHKMIYEKLGRNKDKYFLTQFMNAVSPTLVDAAYFAAFDGYDNKVAKRVAAMFGYMNQPASINISNLTRISFHEEEERYQIRDLVFVPPIVPNTSCMIGIVTTEDEMSVTLHAMKDDRFTRRREFFIQAVEQIRKI